MALSNGHVLDACILSGDVNYALILLATCIENNIVSQPRCPQIQWTICYYNCTALSLLFGDNTVDSIPLIHVNVAGGGT